MSSSVSKNVYLRPIMSPMRPKKIAPNGRTTKPAPNTASAPSKVSSILPFEPNSTGPMMVAISPKM